MKPLIYLVFVLSLFGCKVESETLASETMRSQEQVWVFIQFNIFEEDDELESYYYYAQVSKKMYDEISENDIDEGFILLQNVKYWGDSGLIYDYKDVENSGEIVFRIENIVKIDLVNVEPKAGLGYEQFEESDIELEVPTHKIPNTATE
ncbi:hypothetical protein LRP49_01495 [Enterovibrio sp. ZSDZ35]|uniref:Uncharacterized protein n=1 Tax=Enterovibrio qingdaonensis TaxID=2899818 RepID=A0ABT5QFV9_9GAMM|nr:hypothetical protein [Enterovibrio sp. ZSDZ35]MDD1779858.1 hypothetical protein [Enterovibrio sp. ZSDZ35]